MVHDILDRVFLTGIKKTSRIPNWRKICLYTD